MKAFVTSRAKMKQVEIDTPSYGFLVDAFAVPDGGEVVTGELIHRVFSRNSRSCSSGTSRGRVADVGGVLAATDFVMPGLEIIDSRYENFKFDLASVIADNSSSARFVLGGRCRSH